MTKNDRLRVANAIEAAENGTTGHITVRVVPDRSLDAFERAKREFAAHGLHRHRHANAALVLVAPNARSFAVIGDRELHERVGDVFWERCADTMREYFARGAVIDGVIAAVEQLGTALHEHFPESAEG